MKDMKTFIIGFLLATCMFLLMGNFTPSNKMGVVGKYQGFSVQTVEGHVIYRINTITGEIEKKNRYDLSIKDGLSKKEGWKLIP